MRKIIHPMATLTSTSRVFEAGWGTFLPAEAVHSLHELKPGDVVLQRVVKPGFPQPCHHVLEVIGGDPSGENRPFVRARLIDPNKLERGSAACVVLWDFCLTEGKAQLFRATQG